MDLYLFSKKVVQIGFILIIPFLVYSQNKNEHRLQLAEKLLYEDPDQALKLASQTYNETKEKKNVTFAQVSGLLAEIYSMKGDQKKSIEYAEAGKKTYESLNDVNHVLEMSNIISKEYSVIGLFDEAIRSNNEAVSIAKSQVEKNSNDNNIKMLSITYDTRSYIFDQKVEKNDSLIKYNELSYENSMRLKPTRENMSLRLQSANNLVNTYLKKKNRSKAEVKRIFELLTNARDIEAKFPNMKARAYLTFNFGNYYYTEENDSLALKEFISAINLAEKIEDVYLQKSVHEMLALTYSSMKNPEKELFHQRKYNEISKKISLAEKQNTNVSVNKIKNQQEISFFETKKKLLIFLLLAAILLFLSIFLGLRNYKNYKKEYTNYKKVIDTLEEKQHLSLPQKVQSVKTTSSIAPDKETEILKKISEFEKNEGFRNKNVSLASLAESFDTNTSYISTVINNNKNKNFNNYINELRINYIVQKLKNDPQYLKYKITHLADESGFSSHNTFTAVFSNFIGVSPSNFIKFLSKEATFHKNDK